MRDVNVLDLLFIQAGAIYVVDRGYIDFKKLHAIHRAVAFFVTRAKNNLAVQRRYSRPVDKATGFRSDQTVILTGPKSALDYPEALRRISYYDSSPGKYLVFLTSNFTLPALTIAMLYKAQWRVELFFKWIKQHLRIKTFFGTSENAVKTQVWIAVGVYILVAILKKRLQTDQSFYTILQVLSVRQFEREPLQDLNLRNHGDAPENSKSPKQLLLFN